MSKQYIALSDRYVDRRKRLLDTGVSEDVVHAALRESKDSIMKANEMVYDATGDYCRHIKFAQSNEATVRAKLGAAMILTDQAMRVFEAEVDLLERSRQEARDEPGAVVGKDDMEPGASHRSVHAQG